MRILQVSRSDGGGGAEIVASNLHRELLRAGQDAWLAVGHSLSTDPRILRIPNTAQRNPWRILERHMRARTGKLRGAGRASQWLDHLARGAVLDGWRGLEDFRYPGTWRLLDLPPRRPDVLHLHNLHGGYFDLRALPWLSAHVPTLLLLHDAWLLSGHCAHSFACERWRTGCGSCPDLSIPPAVRRDATDLNWRRKREVYRRSQLTIVTPSEWLMARVRASMLSEAALDTRVIPYGIDLDRFAPGDRHAARALLGLPPDVDILLFAGSDIKRNPWKDYPTLRAAARRLAAARQQPMILLGLGDTGEPEQEGALEIRFRPFTSRPQEVSTYYAAADLYVHAARADTFPNVVLEALACGRAVVATSVGGIPEQVRPLDAHASPTGALVPPANASALASAINRLLDDRHLLRQLELNAAGDARLRFNLRDQPAAYLAVYEHMAEQRAAAQVPLQRWR
jgi:glycosyltransferase involved in cell wall biosynthesis